MKRIAFYGGSFDPPHDGHLTIARELTAQFALDEFVLIPAFHAPHKQKKPTSGFDRYAMLALATNEFSQISVSKTELELPEKPYTAETLARLKNELPDARIFFVMGADSWAEITTWREWEKVLTTVDIIVVTRPDYEIEFSHVGAEIRERIIDLRQDDQTGRRGDGETWRKVRRPTFVIRNSDPEILHSETAIYISDAVQMDVSATEIRNKIKADAADWRDDLPFEVAKYIEKYELYK